MTETIGYALVALAALVPAYLLGAVPFGLIIAKSRGVDLRNSGSKNIGATNVFRCVGAKWGILAFLLDTLHHLFDTFLEIPSVLGTCDQGAHIHLIDAATG